MRYISHKWFWNSIVFLSCLQKYENNTSKPKKDQGKHPLELCNATHTITRMFCKLSGDVTRKHQPQNHARQCVLTDSAGPVCNICSQPKLQSFWRVRKCQPSVDCSRDWRNTVNELRPESFVCKKWFYHHLSAFVMIHKHRSSTEPLMCTAQWTDWFILTCNRSPPDVNTFKRFSQTDLQCFPKSREKEAASDKTSLEQLFT